MQPTPTTQISSRCDLHGASFILAVAAMLLGAEAAKLAGEEHASANSQTVQSSSQGLDKPVTLQVADVPLDKVAAQLAKATGVRIDIDTPQLIAMGIQPNKLMITADIRSVALRHALDWVLTRHELSWRQRGRAVEITSIEAAHSDTTIALIDVSDLVRGDNPAARQDAFDALLSLLTSVIAPETWAEVGGYGQVKQHAGKLLIQHRPHAIARSRGFLAALRKAGQTARAHLDSAPEEISFQLAPAIPAAVQAALRSPVGIAIDKLPLRQALGELQERHQLPMIVDRPGVRDLDLAQLVSVSRGAGVSLADALRQVCRGGFCDWLLLEGALVVTSEDDERMIDPELNLETRAYPVMDVLGGMLPADELDPTRRDFDYDDLIELITTAIDPNSWDSVGGPASVTAETDYGLLVVSQSSASHQEVEWLLTDLRRALAKHARAKVEPRDPAADPPQLVVYTFATPASELQREKRYRDDARAAALKARADSRGRVNRKSTSDVPEDDSGRLPVDSPDAHKKNDPQRDDPFAPRELEKQPDPFGDPSPFFGEEDPGGGAELGEPPDNPFGPGDDQSVPFELPTQPGESPEADIFPPLDPDLGAGLNRFGAAQPGDLPITEEQLLQIITSVIEPESWTRDPQTIAQTAHRRIIIRHRASVHNKIVKLARRLRIKDFRRIDQELGFGGFGGGMF